MTAVALESPEEAVYLGLRIEKLEKPKVAERAAEGNKRGGRTSTKRKNSSGKTFPRAIPDDSTRLTARAAKVVGMSRPSYEKAKAVVASKDSKLIDDMNRTGRVDGAYKRLRKVRAYEALPSEKQQAIDAVTWLRTTALASSGGLQASPIQAPY